MIDLCTLDDVKLNVEFSTPDFDTQLASRITDVSYRVQEWLNIDLELQTYIEVHCGGGKWLYVRNPPIVSVVSIISDLTFDFTGGFTIPVADYVLSNGNWDITHVIRWPGAVDTIQVSYTSGFADVTTVPPNLRQAVAKQVAYEFQHRKSVGLAIVELADGTVTKDENNQFLNSVKQALKPFGKRKIG